MVLVELEASSLTVTAVRAPYESLIVRVLVVIVVVIVLERAVEDVDGDVATVELVVLRVLVEIVVAL